MNESITIGSKPQFTKTMNPRFGSFYNPTKYTQATPMASIPARDVRLNSPRLNLCAMRIRIIASISVQVGRASLRMPHLPRNVRNLVQQWHQFLDIGYIRSRCLRCQGDALGIRKHMVLAPQFTPIRRIWASFVASSKSPSHRAVYRRPRPVDATVFLKFVQKYLVQSLPHSCLLPCLQIIPTGHPATAHFARQFFPRNTCPEHKYNASKNLTAIHRFTPRIAPAPLFRRRQQGLNACPQGICNQWPRHEILPKRKTFSHDLPAARVPIGRNLSFF